MVRVYTGALAEGVYRHPVSVPGITLQGWYIYVYGQIMLTFVYSHTDLKVIVASLSGAMVCILTQQRFDRYRRPVAFFVSFAMGIIGADATLEIIRMFVPGVFSDERAIGAFVCSALIITVILNITGRIDSAMKTEIKKPSSGINGAVMDCINRKVNMKTSEKGLALIKHFEGLRLRAYQCAANVWTIGYGHTASVRPGDVITSEQADAFLRQDVTDSEQAVSRFVRVPLTQYQFDALVSFTFNLGAGNLRTSTLLRRLNVGDYPGAAEQLLRWVNADGKRLPGLIRRREAEKSLFLDSEESG